MKTKTPRIVTRLIWTQGSLLIILAAAALAGISTGSSGGPLSVLQILLGKSDPNSMLPTII